MEITQVRIFPVAEEKLKAFVSVVLDDCFVVSDIKVIQGGQGLFVSMPSKKRKDGSFRDIAHPLNAETRQRFESTIIQRYHEIAGATERSDADRNVSEQVGAASPQSAKRGEDRTWS